MTPTTSYTDIFGSFEHVSIPELGIEDVAAKIDTGAYSGALHCSLIEEVKRDDGVRVLRFVPSDNHAHLMEVEDYERAFVRSSTGHQAKRFIIHTTIVVKGKSYKISIGLSNRSDMHFEILIGRRFLREHNILVDVRGNQELDKDGDNNEDSDSL